MIDVRIWAAETYVMALRTAEATALGRLAPLLARDAVLNTGKEEVAGRDEVLARVTGVWPMTAVYHQGAWRGMAEENGQVTTGASFTHLGAAPKSIELTFSFNSSGMITRIDQITEAKASEPTDTLPPIVRGLVNGALANGTPMVMACTGEDGKPLQSLRGSIQTYGDHQLGIWLRNGQGGTVKALAANPHCSVIYRDSRNRTTLMFEGLGRVVENEAVRNQVFDLSPEVEQLHDPMRKGAAVLIDVTKLVGFTLAGPVRMARAASA